MYVAVSDSLKDESIAAIKALHLLGIKSAMLTGDHHLTADYIGKAVGIDRIFAEVMPGEKASEVKKLQKEGYKVAMIGDGVNDAPALATADVGIAMGTGTDVAIESGDIVLVKGTLDKVVESIHLSQSTLKVIKQNLFWAFFYNLILIPLAAAGLLNPMIAALAMSLSSVSVVTNSLRLKRTKI